MKLRFILKLMALTAFFSASLAGYLYVYSLSTYFHQQSERRAVSKVQTISRSLAIFLSRYAQPAVTLAGLPQMQAALVRKNSQSIDNANKMLDHFNRTLGTDVCYLMTKDGITIASSNRRQTDSFVGQDFSFRPYFAEAVAGNPYSYLAMGITSGKRGLYNSYPVYTDTGKEIVGVTVIKASIDFVESKVGLADSDIIMITDSRGVIFISNQPDWLFQFAWPLSQEKIHRIARERQFGQGPWHWIGLTREGKHKARGRTGEQYLLYEVEIENHPGWKVVQLQSLSLIRSIFSDTVILKTVPIILMLYLSIGVAILFLYRKADHEIRERKSAQKALHESEERYRLLYHNTPAMLHSIGADGRLISVSDYWAEVLGYTREEVIGRQLTDFFTPESRHYAQSVIFPVFFKTGICKDVPYQFVKRSGELVDVQLSATSERDDCGRTRRSLAVSMDVTERKKAERALEAAQQELSEYTRNLERQVRKRTREITSLLKYTPAVVYMKDIQGRYMLVNTRFENIFKVQRQAVRNKTDYQVLPRSVAEQFTLNDQRVLVEKSAFKVEESIEQEDGPHTYLSVKFPIYDGKGTVTGVGGIATDITDLKNARDQLVRLSAAMIDSQEKERAYLARELHDELGQVLTALNMDAVWLQNRLKNSDSNAARRAEGMRALIDKTVEEVRNMSLRLRPGVLDHLGLSAAVEWYTEDFQRRTGITCTFHQHDIPVIDAAVATAAYRIVQEALTNVARHSGAGHVTVSLLLSDGILKVSIEDSGRGFNNRDAFKFSGLGLAGMRERAALVRGKLKVRSQPEKGTRIDLFVQVNNEDNGLESHQGKP